MNKVNTQIFNYINNVTGQPIYSINNLFISWTFYQAITWRGALHFCRQYGMELLSLETEEEEATVFSHFNTASRLNLEVRSKGERSPIPPL